MKNTWLVLITHNKIKFFQFFLYLTINFCFSFNFIIFFTKTKFNFKHFIFNITKKIFFLSHNNYASKFIIDKKKL